MLGEYELNKIYNEDSYEAIKNIPDKNVDCIYTDIPYLYNQIKGGGTFGNRNRPYREEIKDIKDGIDMNILHDFIRIMKKINIFIWCSKNQLLDIMNWFNDNTDTFMELLVWGKSNPTPATNNVWLPDLEYCLYFREKGVKLNDGYHLKTKFDVKPINKRDKDLFKHPTIKPLDMVSRHIRHATQPNDLVADFFIGSGTTAVAAQEANRRFIGFEINEKWADIAKDRVDGINAHGQTSIFTDFEKYKEE